jgi:hypothetical protein
MEVLPRHGDVDRDFSVGEFYLKDAKRRSRHSSNADHRLLKREGGNVANYWIFENNGFCTHDKA